MSRVLPQFLVREVQLSQLHPEAITPFPADTTDSRPARGGDLASPEDVHIATAFLRAKRPEMSASLPLWPWQSRAILISGLILGAIGVLWTHQLITGLLLVLSVSFLCVASLRAGALLMPPEQSIQLDETRSGFAASLPVYSVLVPLFKEAEILQDLVQALSVLSYPRDRLQIILILEEHDAQTRAALNRVTLPEHFETLIVPAGLPQTKPRALNVALQHARGTLVTVYDAEDVPEPDQLLKAAHVFQNAHDELACLQARLNIYNRTDSWLTRQFTLEYSALFDRILPTLQRLSLPVPLGGTSNHFRKDALIEAGGWDPFNVTEDADLGIRFARDGRSVAVLASTTWEEAPLHYAGWSAQRTRWLKGWMQTYLVHMREPGRLYRELGFLRFAGFQMLMGGLIISALVHPWFYVAVAWDAANGVLGSGLTTSEGKVLWALGMFNLVSGYLTAVALGARAALDRGFGRLALSALLVPAYWLLISAAAYRAIAELIKAPYAWNKTTHSARTRRNTL